MKPNEMMMAEESRPLVIISSAQPTIGPPPMASLSMPVVARKSSVPNGAGPLPGQQFYLSHNEVASRAGPPRERANGVILQPREAFNERLDVPPAANPYLELTVEPEDKFRFRYKSEMQGTHGCIHGKNSDGKKLKTFPTIKAHNVPPHIKTIKFRVGIYANKTKDDPYLDHVHKLMWKKYSSKEEDFIEWDVTKEGKKEFVHEWKGMGIIHSSKKQMQEIIYSRLKKKKLEEKSCKLNILNPSLQDTEDIPLLDRAQEIKDKISNKLNIVVLGFEAFYTENDILKPLCPIIYSSPINNLKNPSTGDLKIVRTSSCSGSVLGKDEVFIFVERVKKDDIRIRFFEEIDEEERTWEQLAEFNDNDVHHQYAIVFKTPRYKDIYVTEEVEVYFELFRPSDGAVSERKTFKYKPTQDFRYRKRRRLEEIDDIYSGSHEAVDRPMKAAASAHLAAAPQQNAIQQFSDEIITEMFRPEEPLSLYRVPHSDPSLGTLENDKVYHDGVSASSHVPAIARAHQVDSSCSRLEQEEELAGFEAESVFCIKIADALDTLWKRDESQENLHQKSLSLLAITSKEGNNVLHAGILSKELSSMRRILETCERIGNKDILKEKNNAGYSPLHMAIITGDKDSIRLLLEFNSSPNVRDDEGNTAVHLAIRYSEPPMLALLLEQDCDLDIRNDSGQSPLHTAVQCNSLEKVAMLTKHRLNINSHELGGGKTALHLAIDLDREEIARHLLEAVGADPLLTDFGGSSSQDLAQERGMSLFKNLLPSPEAKSDSNVSGARLSGATKVKNLSKADLVQLETDLFGQWRPVAKYLGFEELTESFGKKRKPTSALVQHLKKTEISVNQIKKALFDAQKKDEMESS